ncbi:invasion associated locus B family protein [Rhizobium sp. 2YAF20]|uniref:invasion associated locus B family protein n=1 Tax=Rhizobium sp. 2YAF20 TaxID=3233027 RepID=UPI003F94AF75
MGFRRSNGFWACRAAAAVVLILPGLALAEEPAAPQATPAPTQQEAPATANAPAPAAPVAAEQSPAPAAPSETLAPAPTPPTPPAAPTTAQSSKTAFGAWTVVCGTPDGSSEKRCVLMQSVISQERPEMQLSVAISKNPGGKTGLLRVQAPLSVLLPNGLGLYVDGTDIGNAYFARCFSDGCYAEVVLEDALLGTLRKGSSATFTVFQTQEEGIGIPVDLKGFAQGYDALP